MEYFEWFIMRLSKLYSNQESETCTLWHFFVTQTAVADCSCWLELYKCRRCGSEIASPSSNPEQGYFVVFLEKVIFFFSAEYTIQAGVIVLWTATTYSLTATETGMISFKLAISTNNLIFCHLRQTAQHNDGDLVQTVLEMFRSHTGIEFGSTVVCAVYIRWLT